MGRYVLLQTFQGMGTFWSPARVTHNLCDSIREGYLVINKLFWRLTNKQKRQENILYNVEHWSACY